MENCALTENMVEWLKNLYLEAAKEERATASNYHLWALGAETQEMSEKFEEIAGEHMEFAHILGLLAKELELD